MWKHASVAGLLVAVGLGVGTLVMAVAMGMVVGRISVRVTMDPRTGLAGLLVMAAAWPVMWCAGMWIAMRVMKKQNGERAKGFPVVEKREGLSV